MRKSALALAVAAALVGFGTAAHADTTLYGSARVSIDYVDIDTPGVGTSWDLWNNSSRLGVRGEEDLGGGLSAIYQYEFGVDLTEGGNFQSNRPKFVGLKGGFGSVTAGTQWTPYYNVIGIADIFNSSRTFASDNYLGGTFGHRMDNQVIYTSPNFSGFSAQVGLVMNGSCLPSDPATPAQLCRQSGSADNRIPSNVSDSIDLWNISATYKNGPFFVGGTYLALEGDGFENFVTAPTYDGDQWGVAVGYNQAPFAVTLSWEQGDVNTVFVDQSDSLYITGQYTFGNNVIRAGYNFIDPNKSRINVVDAQGRPGVIVQDTIDNYLLGYQYNLSKRTRLWVEYLGRRGDTIGDRDVLSIGTRHDF
jgi:predicted porin